MKLERVETYRRAHYPHSRDYETKRVMGRRKSTLAAAMVASAIMLAGGCVTETTDQTLPPYASISDEGRDPASAPKPPPSDDSPGIMSRIGSAIAQLFW
jgi:hypothetical protein